MHHRRTENRTQRSVTVALAGALLVATIPAAFAHGAKHEQEHEVHIDYTHAESHAFGKASDPRLATRTIAIEMNDTMRFTPSEIQVARDAPVRFDVRNRGQVLHELVLGTMEDLKEHSALMNRFPGMEHDEPHMAHVGVGKAETLGWQFTQTGEFYYACLIPGHFEAGMVGRILVN